jgi:hypothetical protein
MISICLSLVALGLVSLAGCQVQEPNDVKTAAETIQVPSLPELLSRASVAVSVSASDTPDIDPVSATSGDTRTLAYSLSWLMTHQCCTLAYSSSTL